MDLRKNPGKQEKAQGQHSFILMDISSLLLPVRNSDKFLLSPPTSWNEHSQGGNGHLERGRVHCLNSSMNL